MGPDDFQVTCSIKL